eukprot:71276-Heterocapsa_arctica.AAC.1
MVLGSPRWYLAKLEFPPVTFHDFPSSSWGSGWMGATVPSSQRRLVRAAASTSRCAACSIPTRGGPSCCSLSLRWCSAMSLMR